MPPNDVTHVAALLKALADPRRLTLLATVAERQAAGGDRSLPSIAASVGMPVKSVVKEAVRLQECGLLSFSAQTMTADLSPLTTTADALIAALPVSALLEAEPDLSRFFTHGRLERLPEDTATRDRVARLLVDLLPEGRTLSEPEVNAVLNEVYDDHATLRRLMVDNGLLTRNGASDYRRVEPESGVAR